MCEDCVYKAMREEVENIDMVLSIMQADILVAALTYYLEEGRAKVEGVDKKDVRKLIKKLEAVY